jgi:predicted Zn-dependent peptidase
MYTVQQHEINNIPVVLVHTEQFKTITLRVQFRSRLSRERLTKRNMLSRMMVKWTARFNTESALLEYLAHHYGAHLTSNVTKKGRDHLVTFNIEFVNSKFVKENLNMLEAMTAVMNDVLHSPAHYTQDMEDFFLRERRLYQNRLKSMKDNRAQKSFETLLLEMFADEDYKYLSHGVLEDIDDITLNDVITEHHRMLTEDEVVISAVGNFDSDITKSLGTIMSHDEKVSLTYDKYPYKPVKEVTRKTDTQKIEQAKLNLGFRAEIAGPYERMAFNVLNQMFGGTASSFLFRNIREEKSLAYQIHSQVDMKNGYLFVLGGVDIGKVKMTEEAVLDELARLQNGDFDDDFVKEIKNMMKISREEAKDQPKALLTLVYNQSLLSDDAPSWEESLDAVDKALIIKMAGKITLDTVYVLTGES